MKSGDLMAELRKCPGGWPFAVKVGTEVYKEGTLMATDEGIFLVFEGKKAAPKTTKKKATAK